MVSEKRCCVLFLGASVFLLLFISFAGSNETIIDDSNLTIELNETETNSTNFTIEPNETEIIEEVLNESDVELNETLEEVNETNSSTVVFSTTEFGIMATQSACGTLSSANTIYDLDRDVTTTGTCFTISADNITLNGNGFKITGDKGSSDNGIYVTNGMDNFTVDNLTIDNFGRGIYIYYNNQDNKFYNLNISRTYYGVHSYYIAYRNSFENITITAASSYGMYLSRYFKWTYMNNISISSSGYGIYFYAYSGNPNDHTVIENSSFYDNSQYNIYVRPYYAQNLTLMNNQFNTTIAARNLYIDMGTSDSYYDKYVITPDNLVNGKKLYWNYSASNVVIDGGDAGAIYCRSCTNVNISNQNLTGKDYYGVYLRDATNVKIENVTTSYNQYGFYMYSGTTGTINNSNSHNASSYNFYSSVSTSISNSNAWGSSGYGFYLSGANSNLTNVTTQGLYTGITAYGGGIRIVNSTITGASGNGIYSSVWSGDGPLISNCNISSNNGNGFYSSNGDNIKIYNSVFDSNGDSAASTPSGEASINIYDQGSGASGVEIINNTLTNNMKGISMSGANNKVENVNITNSSADAIFLWSAYSAWYLSNTEGINFTNVNISGTDASYNDLRAYYTIAEAPQMENIYFNNTYPTKYFLTNLGVYFNFNNEHGDIRFSEYLYGNGASLSSDIQITNASVFINSSKLGTNRAANVTLYNMDRSFGNPQMLRNNELCGAYCTNLTTLNVDTVIFQVSEGGNYSMEDYDITAPVVTSNLPVESFNTSSTSVVFNFTVTDDLVSTLNCSIYINSVLNGTNASVLNNTLTTFSLTGLPGGLNYWNVTCLDSRNNQNWSSARSFYVDIYAPSISNLVYSPSALDDVDPGQELTFNVTVVDDRRTVSSVILQYHNGTTWTNITMVSLGGDVYQENITLVATEQNYTYNIWRNDSFGNSNSSTNQTFLSAWDCTYVISPTDLDTLIGWDETKEIFNLSVNNTGDPQYSGACSLVFRFNHNLADERVYFNGSSLRPSDSFAVGAKENLTIPINATFGGTVAEELLNVTVNEYYSRSTTGNLYSSGTLISTTGGPYLYQSITSSTGYSLYLTDQNISITSTLKNVMGNGSAGRTAYNVSNNWTLPDNFLNDSNVTYFYDNLSNNSLFTNNFNLTFSLVNLPNLVEGTYNISLSSIGYNSSGGVISHADNKTLLADNITITFLCYKTADGICVSDCGIGVDPDCVPEDTSGRSGSGSNSNRKGNSRETSDSFFELLIGEDQEFVLPIENKLNVTKKDIQISVSGANAGYVNLLTKSIASLEPGEIKNITVQITAPAYFSKGEYLLYFSLQGLLADDSIFLEQKTVTLFVLEVSRTEADLLLESASSFLIEMETSGMKLDDVNKLFEEMNLNYGDYNFLGVRENHNLLKEIHDAAFESKKIIEEIYEGIEKSESYGIEVIETKKILYVGETAFKRGDYILALEKLNEAKLTYALETKGEFSLYHTIKNNPWESLGILAGAIVLSFGGSAVIRLRLLKRKFKILEEEEKLLLELMKVVQRETFEKNSMSMNEYQQAMLQYEDKLSKTIEEKITTESKISNLLRVRGKVKGYASEKKRLLELIMGIQDKYLNKGEMETKIYENMLKTYSTRLSEIDEELAFLDAKKAIKENGVFENKENIK